MTLQLPVKVKPPPPQPHRHRGLVDYSCEAWCTRCGKPKQPREAIRCPDCSTRLRHRSYNVKKKIRFRPPNGKRVDYSTYSYCGKCGERRPKEMFLCNECGRQVRHHPVESLFKRMK